MRRFAPYRRAVLALLVVAAALPLAQVAQAGPSAPDVPADIEVGDGNKVFLVGHAVGVQIYRCDGASWTFVAPRADLYGDGGNLIATHYAGPTWEAADGSTVVARVDGRATPDPTAIPWLRLAATSTAAGINGERLVRTTYIQRVATTGGLAPAAAECTSTTAGAVAEVPYTADYYFWKRTGS